MQTPSMPLPLSNTGRYQATDNLYPVEEILLTVNQEEYLGRYKETASCRRGF